MPTLAVYRGETLIESMELGDGTVRIGRIPDKNDLVLPDDGKGVSRTHAELRYVNGGYLIFDLKSANGTWMDGKKVTRGTMTIGREVVVGPYRLVLRESAIGPVPGRSDGSEHRQPLEPPPTPPTLNQSGTSIVARGTDVKPLLQQGPVLIGGGAVLVALLIGAVLWQMQQEPAAPDPPIVSSNASEEATPPPPLPAAGPTPEQTAEAESLGAAKDLIEKGDPESLKSAVTQHLDPILMLNPDHQEANDLKTLAQQRAVARNEEDQKRSRAAAINKAATRPDNPNVRRLQGEADGPYWQRADQAESDYKTAMAQLERGELVAAEQNLSTLDGQFPEGFRDVKTVVVTVRQAKDQQGRAAINAADEAERREDPDEVRRQYVQAGRLGHPEASARSRAFETRATLKGNVLFKDGKQYAAYKRTELARDAFEKALRWLAHDDPIRPDVDTQLKALNPKE